MVKASKPIEINFSDIKFTAKQTLGIVSAIVTVVIGFVFACGYAKSQLDQIDEVKKTVTKDSEKISEIEKKIVHIEDVQNLKK